MFGTYLVIFFWSINSQRVTIALLSFFLAHCEFEVLGLWKMIGNAREAGSLYYFEDVVFQEVQVLVVNNVPSMLDKTKLLSY